MEKKRIVIKNGTIVNEGKQIKADLLIEDHCIRAIGHNLATTDAQVIDAEGMFVLPGAIDDQVHFREPGLTHKGDIAEGSRAAAAGGTTSFMDMPNVKPPTTTIERLNEKIAIARKNSVVNYSFFLGATTDNIEEIKKVDITTTPGIKVFMGSSTGNMLVDDEEALNRIFAESPILIATHCEDTPTVDANLQKYKAIYGDNIPIEMHPLIRSREACLKSSTKACELARKHHAHLHLFHLSTKEEIALLDKGERNKKRITGEVCVHHLWFNDTAYKQKGAFVKWNPAIKTEADRVALVQAINDGTIDVIATDHAPHTIAEKEGVYTQAASGGPMVQHALITMMELAYKGETTLENVVDKMAHAPAEIYHIHKRGFLKPGYFADIVLVQPKVWTVDKCNILYKCGWSPLEGQTFHYKVATTLVNGEVVYDKDIVNSGVHGQQLTFDR